MMFKRNDILAALRQNVLEVRFIKVNGQERTMRCTLFPAYIPQATDMNYLSEMHEKPENINTVVCWDTEAKGWRSFRVENVSYMESIENF